MDKREQYEQQSFEEFYSEWGAESEFETKEFVDESSNVCHESRTEYTHSIRFINIRDYNDG